MNSSSVFLVTDWRMHPQPASIFADLRERFWSAVDLTVI